MKIVVSALHDPRGDVGWEILPHCPITEYIYFDHAHHRDAAFAIEKIFVKHFSIEPQAFSLRVSGIEKVF